MGYLAAGGQRSQLVVKRLDTDWSAQATVGGSINNAMCIARFGGGERLLICNNDETVLFTHLRLKYSLCLTLNG
jgi:hypothetical protein